MTEQLWSVTSIISGGLGISPGLNHWGAQEVARNAIEHRAVVDAMLESGERDGAVKWLAESRFRSSGRAKIRGSELHAIAEQLALGAEPDVPEGHQPYIDRYIEWLQAYEPRFLLAEAPVFNVSARYAGTLDGIMEIGGQTVLFDLKTTEHHPHSGKTRPPFPETALQLVAYAHAEQVGLFSPDRVQTERGRFYRYDPEASYEPMPAVDGAIVLVLSPHDCLAVPARIDQEIWETFLLVRENFRWREETGIDLYGTPLTAPEAVR